MYQWLNDLILIPKYLFNIVLDAQRAESACKDELCLYSFHKYNKETTEKLMFTEQLKRGVLHFIKFNNRFYKSLEMKITNFSYKN